MIGGGLGPQVPSKKYVMAKNIEQPALVQSPILPLTQLLKLDQSLNLTFPQYFDPLKGDDDTNSIS